MQDLYATLGVAPSADQDAIRRAYRQLARRFHPDLNPAETDRFKAITAAYDVLGNPQRRALYDEFGDICLKPGFDPVVARHAGLGQGARQAGEDGLSGHSFSAFFDSLHSPATAAAGTRPYQGSPGRDDAPDLGFSSAAGTTPYRGSARDDDGMEPHASSVGTTAYRGSAQEAGRTGFQPHTSKQEAYFPGKQYGNGRSTGADNPYRSRMQRQRTPSPAATPPPTTPPPTGGYAHRMSPGHTTMPVPGSDVHVNVDIGLLESLRGTSRDVVIARTVHSNQQQQEALRVSIRAGISDGEQLRLRGRGNHGRAGGPPGDLVVTVTVKPSRHLRRQGHDLFLELPVTLQEAVLGATIEVPTPDGMLRVQLPPKSSNGRQLRLRQRGVSVGNGQRGDLYIVIRPTPPNADSPAVRRLLAELEQHYPEGGVRDGFEL